jgi:Glycosyl hydrolases family 2, TIM barrel domain/Glycosyl hydrolases family 2, sugar binding domain/Glycosyl hydrolases family 2
MSASAPDWPADRHCLDGTWEFIPGDHDLADLAASSGAPITVPGLWEAQGYPGLDGVAWYRRQFSVADPAGWWTMRFGAVMDDAEAYLNGRALGAHRGAFTPFELECPGLVAGVNEIAVRVTEHPSGTPAHLRSAHGKQGWMNNVFPSPPSLYLTYGGIWQSVWLDRHGPARITDCWVSADPDDLTVEVTAAGQQATTTVVVEALGTRVEQPLPAGPADATVTFRLGKADAPLWSPRSPVLHEARVCLYADGRLSDTRRLRFGLRTIALRGNSFELNGVPFTMRSALVQGFSAGTLYGAQSRAEAEAEVRAAQQAGLNTLRLHIKAFDPVYLDVCDELGMLLHCDIPVAEPIAHDELGPDGPVTEQCVAAATEQVRRDRGHPSIVLWSAMNELGEARPSVRAGVGYEGFARRLYDAVRAADPTRPVIENDWMEPDPERVFRSPLLTAHWYGRLSRDYLAGLRDRATRWAATGRPLLLSEFGDWGLPDLSGGDEEHFWRYGAALRDLVESTPWPASVADFVAGTQRYQGLADRFQIELLRQVPGVPGWCLTELTDVPQELNGLLDLLRRPKQPAIEEIRRASQDTCPILVRPHWSAHAGGTVDGELVIVNDGPASTGAEVMIQLGNARWQGHADLPAHGITPGRPVSLPCPLPPGQAQLDLTVRWQDEILAASSYPVRVLARPRPTGVPVMVRGDSRTRDVLRSAGASIVADGAAGPDRALLVIGEGALDAEAVRAAAGWLGHGGPVLLLAQHEPGLLGLPVPIRLSSLDTAWGSTPFVFTTGEPAIEALPPAAVLASELLTTSPDYVYTDLGGTPFAPATAVGVLKPPPGELLGTVVGQLAAGNGLITLCQLPLTDAARAADPLALALIGDLLRWSWPQHRDEHS